nr:MAG TPA: Baseplate wedge protein [Caudoviricetes sp.]
MGISSSSLIQIKDNINTNTTYNLTKSGSTITLRGSDGSTFNVTDSNTVYGNATASAAGLMSAADKAKLDGVAAGSNHVTVDAELSTTSTNPVQNKVIKSALDGKSNTGHTHDDRYYTKTEVNTKLDGKSNTGHKHVKADITDFPTSMPASDVYAWAKAASKPSYTIGEVSGNLAASRISGTISAANLPSYVDDVLEYASLSKFPTTGESGKIYTALDTNKIYRWSGSAYVVISETVALGTTHSSAGYGDESRAAYNHSTKTSGNPHHVTKADVGLGSVDNTSDANKSVKYAASAGYATSANSATSATSVASRGNVTAETGVSGRPAVAGLSMSQVYNNGYPTPYGNVISLRGTGDGQVLVGWSGTDGGYAPVYVRSKRNNTSTAVWADWQQFYTTGYKPTKADVGLGNVDNTADSAKSVKYATSAGSASSASSVPWTGVSDRPSSMPASDVYAWAKASSKPSYSWSEISGRPTIPSVGNGTVTITQNGTNKGSFTLNQSGNATIALTDTNTNTWRPEEVIVSSSQPNASTCKLWIKG